MTAPTGTMTIDGIKISLPFHEAGKTADQSTVSIYDLQDGQTYWASRVDATGEVLLEKTGNKLNVCGTMGGGPML